MLFRSPRCSSFALASAPGESRTAAPALSKKMCIRDRLKSWEYMIATTKLKVSSVSEMMTNSAVLRSPMVSRDVYKRQACRSIKESVLGRYPLIPLFGICLLYTSSAYLTIYISFSRVFRIARYAWLCIGQPAAFSL